MALGDISVISPSGQNLPASTPYRVAASATLIQPGEPVVISTNYVLKLATSTPTTTLRMLGVATSLSTNTASLDGLVDVQEAIPGLVYSTRALTPANINTDAKLLALLNKRVLFDLTSSVFTVAESTVDNSANGLQIVGGDIVGGFVFYKILGGTAQYVTMT